MSGSEWEAHLTEDGMTFYYNTRTGESSWQTPEVDQSRRSQQGSRTSGWKEVWSDEHRMHYYYDEVTGATQWEKPEAIKTASEASKAPSDSSANSAAVALVVTAVQPVTAAAKSRTAADERAAVAAEPTTAADESAMAAVEPETAAVDSATATVEPETPAVEPETPAVELETPAEEPETPAVDSATATVEPETPAVEWETPAVQSAVATVEPETPAVEPPMASPQDGVVPIAMKASALGAYDSTSSVAANPRGSSSKQFHSTTLGNAASAETATRSGRHSPPPSTLFSSTPGITCDKVQASPTTLETQEAAEARKAPAAASTTSPPSTEREGATLREALDRRETSLMRLQATREAAQERIAKLKADGEARRNVRARQATAGISLAEETPNMKKTGGNVNSKKASPTSGKVVSRGVPVTFTNGGANASLTAAAAGRPRSRSSFSAPSPRRFTKATPSESSGSRSPRPMAAEGSPRAADSQGGLAKVSAVGEGTKEGVSARGSKDVGKADTGSRFVRRSVGGAVDFGTLETTQDDKSSDHDDEMRKGWEKVSLFSQEANEELSAIKASATVGTDADGFSLPFFGRDTKGKRGQKRGQLKKRGGSYDDKDYGQMQMQNNQVLLVTRARNRLAEMFNLLGSIGEEQAWLRRVSAENHRACQQLVDFAAAGATLLLTSAKRETDPTHGGGLNKSVGLENASATALKEQLRSLCYFSLGCLAFCGRISPGMWNDFSRQDGGTNTVIRLLSLCLDLVEGDGSDREGGRGRTGLDEEKYFFGRSKEADREEKGDPKDGGDLNEMALRVIFEVLTGCCKTRMQGLQSWDGMGRLVDSLMDTIVKGMEESHMMATRALIAANDPFWRSPQLPPLPGKITDVGPAPVAPPSTVIPALCAHPARHDVQTTILHILNDEGYPNGDPEVARLCLVFCTEAFESTTSKALFYINDFKIMVDLAIRELENLPTDDGLRGNYVGLLRRILNKSEWAALGERYREAEIRASMGAERNS